MNSRACRSAAAAAGLGLCVASVQAALPIEQWRTVEGAKVLFVETRGLPMLDVAVDFPAGASRDVAGKGGAAMLTMRLMRLGAGGLGEDEISERFANVGAQLSGRFDMDRAGYALRTLSSVRECEESVALLGKILQQPVFDRRVFEREKARGIAGLREMDTKPEAIADREFKRLIYGSHSYGQRGAGEVETVERLTRADVQEFYRVHYVADHAVVSIIGDLSRDDARALAARLTAGLGRASWSLRVPAPVPALAAATTSRIPHPATQAHVIIGQPGITRNDPDYFALWLGNYVLGGGGFSSRLNEEIRQKRGFAYSAYSYFTPLQAAGPFQIGLQTRREQADEALAVARETLARFIAEGPTEQELSAAKQNIVGGFPLRIDSNGKIHEYLSLIGFYNLPLTYLDDFPAKIESLTVDDVSQAWRRRIYPDRMATVVVGAAEAR